MTKPGQDLPILPKVTERRRIQTLYGLKELCTDLTWVTAKRRTNSVHRSKKIHHERNGRPFGSLEQEGRTSLPKDALGDLSGFEHGVYFNTYALELSGFFEVRYKGLQIRKRHDAVTITRSEFR